MVSYQGDTKYLGREMISVAFDIGTTNSAVSYTYLYPDDYARVRMVNRWPGQPESVGSSKIPTLLAYRNGQCKACGAEALEYVDNSHYHVAKWFKLHLHPSSMKTSNQPPPYGSTNGSSAFETPPLPPSISVDRVYADFMKYLMDNAQLSFEQSVPNGPSIWRRLRESLVVILTTPNGWDLSQQHILRKAAIESGIVQEEKTHDLLEFVTEGEASVHYALAYSQSKAWLSADSIFAVIDAGGSTVDSTLYECKATDPKVLLEEVCPSECIQAGGVFIDRAAETMLRQKLAGSRFVDDESIADMIAAFESRTKRLFDGSQTSYTVDFGGNRDNDRPYGIIKGKLSLTKHDIESTFEDVIDRTVESCLNLLRGRKIQYILLVGGLGESLYLQRRLVEIFEAQSLTVVTVEEPAKKAAAEGAMIWYIKQSVMARVARMTLGASSRAVYDPHNPEHVERNSLAFVDNDGVTRIKGRFSRIISKGTRMHTDFEVTNEFLVSAPYPGENYTGGGVPVLVASIIHAWEGEGVPQWLTESDGRPLRQMRRLCTLTADVSGICNGGFTSNGVNGSNGPNGGYQVLNVKMITKLGGTRLQARFQWNEGGILREGPVLIIPGAIA